MPIINPSPGTTGPQGPQGIQGIQGLAGIPGFDGESGEDGFPIPGSSGPAGANGTIGRDGSQGIPGEDGLNGEDSFIPGLQGIQGIQGFRGADGEDGLVNDDFWPGFNPFIDDPLEQISRIQDRNLTILPNYSAIVVGPYTINSGKKLTIGSGGRFKIEQGAPDAKAIVFAKQTADFTNPSPATTELMAGLASTNSTQLVTPKTSGTLFVVASGVLNRTTGGGANSFLTTSLFYGIGTAPAAGSAISGTRVGNAAKATVPVVSTGNSYTFNVIVTGLVVGTTYWFDCSVFKDSVSPASDAQLQNTNFVAIEL